MDLNRIDKSLKRSIENSPRSLELDLDTLRFHPEIIQQEREDFIKNNPYPKPSNINTRDIYFNSSVDQQPIRIHVYQANDFISTKVILYFHGGGYIFGLPEQVDEHMYKLANDLKATIVSVDYRLSPKYPFPTPVLDGFDALKWLINQGKKTLEVKPDEIIIYGGSAGAHLAASVTQMAIDNDIHNIKQQVLLYPVIHNKMNTDSMNEFVDAPLWNKEYAEIAWKHFLGENSNQFMRYADLTCYDNFKALPKTTIIACELDPLRDEGIEYASKLYQAGVSTELWVIPGAVHVFDLFETSMSKEFYEYLIRKLN